MRNQFYSDRKDIWKWPLLLELAGDSHHIYQVAMQTPDKGKHTLDVGGPGDCNKDVRAFFEQERRDVAHDIYRVEKLLDERITVLPARNSNPLYYENGQRNDYFDRVCDAISASGAKPKVVFVDPDNGIEVKNSTRAHVRIKHLRRLWDLLASGDYLVIYQHHPRENLDALINEKKQLLAENLGVELGAIKHKPDKGVTFFWIRKGRTVENTSRASKAKEFPPCDLELSGELHERLTQIAQQTGRTVAYHIETAVREYVEDHEDYLVDVAAIERDEPRISLEQLEREIADSAPSTKVKL